MIDMGLPLDLRGGGPDHRNPGQLRACALVLVLTVVLGDMMSVFCHIMEILSMSPI